MVPLTYDPEANARISFYCSKRQFPGGPGTGDSGRSKVAGEVILDLDNSGYLLGVELIGAKDLLRSDTLAAVESQS